ncbi:MAG: hypothetical protein ABEJ68_05135 [Halobacteriaceae archaeon]
MSDGGDGTSRRTLLRIVIALAVGIPVLVEGLTFAGLLGSQFGGGGSDDAENDQPTTRTGVGIGDTLSVEGDVVARLSDGALRQGAKTWTLELTVSVRNEGDVPYELGLETVTTTDGASASGGATTGKIPPGESATVTETWALPPNATPTRLTVVTTTHGTETRTRATVVTLGKIPVQG